MIVSSSFLFVFFFKQKTAYEMRISDWSSDVCSSDLLRPLHHEVGARAAQRQAELPAGRFQRVAQSRANRIGDGNVRHHAGPEERLLPRKGTVDELIDDDEAARRRSEERRGGKEGVRTGR